MNDKNLGVGKTLGQLRKSRGLTQTELAKRAGVSLPMIYQIETGKVGLSMTNLYKLASAAGYKVNIELTAIASAPPPEPPPPPIEHASVTFDA